MIEQRKTIVRYVNAATDLAESVKKNIQHGGKITKETVLKLNEFSIAANAVSDFIDHLKATNNKYDN